MKNSFTRKDYSILIVNAIDHFDTAIYGFLAPILAPLFFPHEDPLISLIISYSIFATSIFTRPIGSYIFGVMAYKHTPMKALIYSLIGVSVATGLTGILPIYETCGVLAPILLILLRVIRGICAAGESAIAKLYIIEDKSEKLAIRSSYLYQTSSMAGIVVASFLSTWIISIVESSSYSNQFILNHLWRVCYILGSLTGLFVLVLRKYDMSTSGNFKTSRDSGVKIDSELKNRISISNDRRSRIVNFFRKFTLNSGLSIIYQNKLKLLRITFVFGFSYITYSTAFILLNSFIPLVSDFDLTSMMKINTKLLVFDLVMLPVLGVLTEGFSIRLVMSISALILGVTIIPLWYFLEDASYEYIFFFRAWVVFWGVVFACPFNLWCSRQVEGNNKYIIIGIASSIGSCIIGKMNVAICLYLYHYLGDIFTELLSNIWQILGGDYITSILGLDLDMQFGSHMIVSFYLAIIMLSTAALIYFQGRSKNTIS